MADALGYVRVSTGEQADSGLGLQAQRDAITNYCALRHFELKEIYEDAGISSGTVLAGRPAGRRLMEDARDCHVVVMKLDRAWRSTVDCLRTIARWEKADVTLHLLDMGGNSVDTSSSAGKFLITILVAVAEMERKRISERTKEALRASKKLKGSAPFGFAFRADREALVAHRRELPILRRILKLKEEGRTSAYVAAVLNRDGQHPRLSPFWDARSIRTVWARTFPPRGYKGRMT